MNDDPSSLSLDHAITIYLRSEYFTGLSAITKAKRRGMLRNMRADVLDLLGLPMTPLPALALLNTRPVPQFKPYSGVRKNAPDKPRSYPKSPQRRSWTIA